MKVFLKENMPKTYNEIWYIKLMLISQDTNTKKQQQQTVSAEHALIQMSVRRNHT